MEIFQKSVINKHLTKLDKEQIETAYQKFRENYSPARIEKIKQLKEEEYQDGFLPPNSISRIIDTYHKLTELDACKPIYEIYKQYFGYMNIGRKGKNTGDDILAYNGGLFYPDEILDSLKIDDNILIADLLRLSSYDFKTFVAELKKQKVKLSLIQQDEWEEYFNTYKTEINTLQIQINQTDKAIDQMVYELYGLSEEEIGIIEKSVNL